MRIAVLMLSLLSAVPAFAQDRALVIGNSDYAEASDISGAVRAQGAAEALRAAGFTVSTGTDLSAAGQRNALSALLRDLTPDARVVILLAGHFAHSDSQSWFVGVEAAEPDLATIGGQALSVQSVLEVAALAPGRAVVLLGTEDRRARYGRGLIPGIGQPAAPQGVTIIQGDASGIANFARDLLPGADLSLAQMLNRAPGLVGRGFLPVALPFRGKTPQTTTAPVIQPPAPVVTDQTEAERAEEDRVWGLTRAAGALPAYETYLRNYPRGRYAALAQSEIDRLRNDPTAQAQAAEEALKLTRDQRRTIQRQLSLLGFDPRGIDGVFGRGSRAAISAWQGSVNATATGYINRDQLTRLGAQADRRAAELEAEAAARKAEQDRQDRIYWDQTGAAGDEVGLRAYIKRFPDGLYADVAQSRLAVFDDARRAQAAAQDRAAWDRATAANAISAYRDYLTQFPQGAFAAEATARIEALQADAQDGPARAQAEAAENALGLNGLARVLIERRLAGLGFDPGQADGQFDDRTRRAIRRFQASRGLPETGYVDQQSMVALLAGGAVNLGD